jgi:hypothetical protein
MSQDEVKKMQDFAREQMLKVQDIIKTIRRHHGTSIGDRMTLVANMVSHLHQNIALDAGMLVLAISNDNCTHAQAVHMVKALSSIVERSTMLPVATFDVLFSEEEKKELLPFMTSIDEILQQIVKRLTDKILR